MKKSISLLFMLLICTSTWAKTEFSKITNNSFKPKQQAAVDIELHQLWQKYLACSEERLKDDEVAACLKKVITSEQANLALPKFYEFLSLGFSLSNLYKCEQKFCFQIFGGKKDSNGILSFRKERGHFRIEKIQY